MTSNNSGFDSNSLQFKGGLQENKDHTKRSKVLKNLKYEEAMRNRKRNIRDESIPALLFLINEISKEAFKKNFDAISENELKEFLHRMDEELGGEGAMSITTLKKIFDLRKRDSGYRPKNTSIAQLLKNYLEYDSNFMTFEVENEQNIKEFFEEKNYRIERSNPSNSDIIMHHNIKPIVLGGSGLQLNLDEGSITKIVNVIIPIVGDIFNKESIKKTNDLTKFTNQRVSQRLILQENRRQQNIENIVKYAISETTIKGKPTSNLNPETDWMINFFDLCQDISNEELQKMWAKILAKEVDKPGSFRRRTMHTLKLISPSEANWFNQFCKNLIWISDDYESNMRYYCMITQLILLKNGTALDFAGVSSYEMYRLEEIGLVNELAYDFKESDGWVLNINNENYENTKEIDFELETYTLSLVGENIFLALETSLNTDYLEICTKYLIDKKVIMKKEI